MLKHKPDFQNIFCSFSLFLLFFSVLILVGSVDGANGPFYGTYYASAYNISNGTYVLGSVPSSVTSVDADYLTVRSVGTETSSSAYNPNGYNLLGSTTLDLGSVSNLANDDGSYMTFKSYASNFSSADNNAFFAYQAGAAAENRIPKYRTWNGSAWSSQGSMQNADSPLRWVRSVCSPLEERYYEKIVVTLSDDQYLDAYVWNGTSWSNSSNIGQVGAVSFGTRSYDVEYEKTSGKALLVWSTGGGTVDTQYKIWDGVAWSSAYNLDFSGTASGTDIYWIAMARNPTNGSNELALAAIDATDSEVYGLIWNGTAWGNEMQLGLNVAMTTEEDIAVAYEQTSGHAIFVWGSAPDNTYSRRWNGTAWDASSILVDLTSSAIPNWLALKPDPASDRLMLVAVDGASDLNTAEWNGTTWTTHTEHDDFVNTHAARVADVDWEPSGSRALLVWGTDTTSLSWKTWTPAGGWSSRSDFDYAGVDAVWVKLRRDPRGVGTAKIFVSASDVNFNGFLVKWNGVAPSDSVTFTTQMVSTTYENFDLAFRNFAEPNEHTLEVEFTGTSNTNTWTQLNWTIDAAWDTANVSVTMQLYNYSSGAYPTSGDGYIKYTSSSTANTDENKNQTIVNNPEYFKDFSGNWRVKVKGVKSANTLFKLRADWIEFEPTYYNEYTVSTEFAFSNMTTKTPTQLNFTVVSQYNRVGVNVTIQVWNYSSAAYATSGQSCLNYLSSGVNETKRLSIITSPQFFTSNGNAKIKITGVLGTTTQYWQEMNQVRLLYSFVEVRPEASFTYSPSNPCTSETVTFNATASYDLDGEIVSYIWDFGDGTNGTGVVATHVYASRGTYNVTLIVTDDDSYVNSTKRILTVYFHDIAIVDVAASATEVISGQVVNFTVFVKNNGTATETFNVTLFYNETVIETKILTNLAPGSQTTLEFAWNTTGLKEASYTIRAEVNGVLSETETKNNAYEGAIIRVSTQISSQPFNWFITLLAVLPFAFGLVFLFGLKLKRKKKAKARIESKIDAFSEQFGMAHQQMVGKKMLLEIDPTSDYHKSLLNFASEAQNNNEPLFIFTNKNSTLHSMLSGVENVNLGLLTSKASSPQQVSDKQTLLPATDLSVLLHAFDMVQRRDETPINVLFDNLSDAILRCGFGRTYKFMRLLLETLSSSETTVLFVFNPSSHGQAISSSIRGLFKIQLAYTKSGPKVGPL